MTLLLIFTENLVSIWGFLQTQKHQQHMQKVFIPTKSANM